MASGYGYAEIAQALIRKGAHVNEVDIHGWSALYLSQSKGHNDIVQMLEQNGATPVAIQPSVPLK